MRNPVDPILIGFSTRHLLVAFVTVLIATIALACGSSSSESEETAPDFSLPVANRNVDITLSGFRGDQNVVLVFYRGFFWGICLGQLVELQSYYPRIRQQNAEILAVSMDDFGGAATMIANSGATFPVLYTSKSREIPSDYEVYDLHNDGVAAPAVFIIDTNGNITYEYIGKDIADRPDTAVVLAELQKLNG